MIPCLLCVTLKMSNVPSQGHFVTEVFSTSALQIFGLGDLLGGEGKR